MGILGALWAIRGAYDPSAAREARKRGHAVRFGAFSPTWAPPYRRPRNDREAQRLYNHIRTVAFYLDAAPILSDLGLPFRFGLDDLVSLIPIWGDLVSGVLQLYQVYLSFVFGMSLQACGWMVLNVLIDVAVGIVPFIGDVLDNLFKANLRNLALLEEWLLSDKASRYHILLMPDSESWLPPPKKAKASRWSAWFGPTGSGEADDDKERERASGAVPRTRRMGRHEGEYEFGVGVPSGAAPRSSPRVEPLD